MPWMNRSHSLNLTLPPLAGIVLKLKVEHGVDEQHALLHE